MAIQLYMYIIILLRVNFLLTLFDHYYSYSEFQYKIYLYMAQIYVQQHITNLQGVMVHVHYVLQELVDEANKKVNELNKSEEQLLGAKLDVIVQYERTLESTLDETLESSVDKLLIPDFAKREGAQEVVSRGRKLRKRYDDFKCSLENQLAVVQAFLLQVQNYEASLGVVEEWLKKEKEIIDSIELTTCTTEKINSELIMIKVTNVSSK